MIAEIGLIDILLAFLGGSFLALMINSNGVLSKNTSPLFTSFVAHGLGTLLSLFLVVLQHPLNWRISSKTLTHPKRRNPYWLYCGGLTSITTVILASIAVNRGINLPGSIALMLLGQIFFGIFVDYFGILGISQRKIQIKDLFALVLTLLGSGLVIFGGN